MFCLTRETQNLGRVETGNSERRGSITSASKTIRIARSRVYKDEALVSAALAELPALLASLESFRER
ncbi:MULTISPECIES: hypothetical protein [unclassified Microcoleus]|uniref:hypothetical protein n=1 Tax=unclassified Microcoleus TaxID=2642155 RepID=UPI002FD5781F